MTKATLLVRLFALTAALLSGTPCGATAPTGAERAIAANDNRIPAGARAGSTLTLELDATSGIWYPDGEQRQGIPMLAFAQRGHAPQIPGPLVRVPVGTDVRLRIRNTLPGATLVMHDLVDLPSHADRPVEIASGTERIIRIHTFAPGTYHYWGATTTRPLTDRYGADSQLSGAIVVDPPGRVPNDRIFVLGAWGIVHTPAGKIDQNYKIVTINGRSWPATERLSYAQGERVTWRVINASAVNHPMHLHGFPFDLVERGDGLTIAPTSEREVTELLTIGGTAMMRWSADRPGTWLYHCHIGPHTIAHLPTPVLLSGKRSLDFEHTMRRAMSGDMNNAMSGDMNMNDDMGGMIIAVTVRRSVATSPPPEIEPVRHIELAVRTKPEVGNDAVLRPSAPATALPIVPAFEYAVRERGDAGGSSILPDAATIVLTRGIAVGINISNELAEPTSVHWHGIEMADSYYDGTAGFPNGYGRVAPLIAAGASFEAKFTPNHAGTFIFHAHADDYWQLLGGLAGALVVLEPGQSFDPLSDHIVMLTTPRDFRQWTSVNVNGRATPQRIAMVAGTQHRLRLINITGFLTDLSVTLEAAPDSSDVVPPWRLLARDGYDLPVPLTVPGGIGVTVGATRDVVMTPLHPGHYVLDVRSPRNGPGSFTTIPLDVIEPPIAQH